MKVLKLITGILLGVTSAWLVLAGAAFTLQALGPVTGSEYGMLVTLANLVASIVLWLGVFGWWAVTPAGATTTRAVDEAGE